VQTPALPVFVISLQRSLDRRRVMEQRFGEIGLQFEFSDAVDGAGIDLVEVSNYDRDACRRRYGYDLSPSELGCYLSHYGMFQRIVKEHLPAAVIMEDDVELNGDVPGVIDAISKLSPDWDLIRLCGMRNRKARARIAFYKNYGLARLINGASGAHAYALSRRGAQKLIAYCSRIVWPIDTAIDRFWDNDMDILAVQPYPVRGLLDLPSIIGVRGKESVTRIPYAVRTRRRVLKLRDSIRKRTYLLRQPPPLRLLLPEPPAGVQSLD
jgi:glycosyl transferase family 25